MLTILLLQVNMVSTLLISTHKYTELLSSRYVSRTATSFLLWSLIKQWAKYIKLKTVDISITYDTFQDCNRIARDCDLAIYISWTARWTTLSTLATHSAHGISLTAIPCFICIVCQTCQWTYSPDTHHYWLYSHQTINIMPIKQQLTATKNLTMSANADNLGLVGQKYETTN